MSELMKKLENGMSFGELQAQATLLLKSGFLPTAIKTPEQAIAIIIAGRELNLGMMESLRSINVIQGKPCMSAQLLLALCQRTGKVEDVKIVETTDQCSVTLKRKGQTAFTAVFTMQDARDLGLADRDNWKKQKKTMLRWRATAQACRVVFPDAVSGVYLEEEIADEVIVTMGENPEVTEVITHQPQKESIPDVKPASEGAALKAEDIPEDQLGNWEMPTGKYKGMTLNKIYAEETGTGDRKGYQYLKWCAENLTTFGWKDIIRRFIEMMDDIEADSKAHESAAK